HTFLTRRSSDLRSFKQILEGRTLITANSHYPSSTVRTTFAGEPITMLRAGTSLVTTEAAATTASSPMVTPGSTVTLAPIHTLLPTIILPGRISARRVDSIL